MKIKDIYVIKKDGTKQSFDGEKIVRAINASAKRIGEILSAEDEERTVELVLKNIHEAEVPILTMHSLVEKALDEVNPKVAKCYRDYRNYKTDMARMLAEVNGEADKVLFGVDRSNANSDGNLVSTKRALIFGAYEKTMYREFFLNKEERQADKDGYIYVHDKSARMITMNCCLFDMEHVLKGGFKMGGIHYNEPSSLDTAFDVIRQNGLRQPIDVLPEKNGTTYRIIGGHRRFAAIKQGIEEGYGWFSKGIPCVIQPHQIENTIDEQIVMYEENLSSRNYQDGNYLEGVKTLYMLYQEKSRNDEEFKGSALIRRLAEKLNVGTRQAYKTAFIATSAAPWITNAVEDRLLPIDVAAMISHLDDDKQKALHKIFNEHQMIPKEILNMYRKGFQKKQESSDDGSSQENISESGPQEVMEEPKEIQATSKEEEPGHPAVSEPELHTPAPEPETHIPVSEPVMHTQEVSGSVPEASRQQMPVLEGVSKQPVAAPGFHVPEPPKPSVPVDLAGQQTEEPVARPVLQTEQYPKEDQSSTEQCPGEEKTQTVLEKSHEEEKAQAAARKQEIKDMVSLYDDSNFFGENDIEDPYDGYDNADYAGYDDPEEPDYEDDVEEERSVCTPVNYHVDTTDSALTALAWFSEMVDRNGASEQEMAYVDTIVKMLAKFYFPHFVKQGYVDGKMRDTVKEIVDMMSGLV